MAYSDIYKSALFTRILFLFWFSIFTITGISNQGLCTSRQLKVGIYNFEPLVAIDENDKGKGLFIDVLEIIAEKENWDLSYVPGTWNKN
ncbi:MAG: hypothetical protein KJ737_05730 [Proteobacteria bacterium]|nr:hypothetical protein [Pseudomonadota bacterium]